MLNIDGTEENQMNLKWPYSTICSNCPALYVRELASWFDGSAMKYCHASSTS
ncbi:hypothetical protein TRE132_33280 [Pseudomonas chlororaphis subsp. aurantiaca]|nr:hypothetical protein TRE132_33280 [Pseudomonas chlororaphis subsp. aurantiaca]